MRIVADPVERTSAATDLLLTLAALAGVVRLLLQSPPGQVETDWAWAFGLLALAAALGAGYHGLVLADPRRAVLWQTLTFGLALAIAMVAAGTTRDAMGAAAAEHARPFLLAAGIAVYAVSRRFPGLFLVFIVFQASVLLYALAVYAHATLIASAAGPGFVAAGITLSLTGAVVQARRRFRVKLAWAFDHNGVFHLLQTAGVILMWVGLGIR